MVGAYRIFAIRYGRHARKSSANFIGGDEHDIDMPLDYFVWAVCGEGRTIVVDTGFGAEAAKQRGRILLRPVEEGLKAVGIDTSDVSDVVITHMHYDHAGNAALFPRARFHLQDAEMAYCTGRCMTHPTLAATFDSHDVAAMVQRVFERRVVFHRGDETLLPGLELHLLGGHTKGLQALSVATARGRVILASDALHLYANLEREVPFPIVVQVEEYLEALRTLRRLAPSIDHIIPGHDPLVLERFPRHAGYADIVRLDLPAL